MKQLFLSLFVLVSVISPVRAQEALTLDSPDIMPPIMESHNYTYVFDEEGNAKVWLRVDGVKPEKTDRSYELTLPEGFKGNVMAWHKENGCLKYTNDMCVYYGSTNWKEVSVSLTDNTVVISIPATRFTGRYGENNAALGIAFNIEGTTAKKWWGRTVTATSVKSNELISYLNAGVYLPEGVYTRDKSQGPSGWATGISETMSIAQNRPADTGFSKMAGGAMLDMAGSGQIYRNRQNLMPGEAYSFSFMSSTSLWKLFYPEIGFSLGWLIAIGTVLALLMRLIIGRKPLSWYFAVTGLLVLLGVMIGGLWFTYHTAFATNPSYPMPYYGGFGGGAAEPAVLEAPPTEDSLMQTDIAPMETEVAPSESQ